jgi:hypothetical protein
VLAGLDSGVDDWRAVQVVGALPQAARQLVPRLCDHLRRIDLADEGSCLNASGMLSALAALGDRAALPVITEALTAAVSHGQSPVICSALKALAAFGPESAPVVLDTLLQTWTHNPQRPTMSWHASTGWAPPRSRRCRNSARSWPFPARRPVRQHR